jgi:hypothetical protein
LVFDYQPIKLVFDFGVNHSQWFKPRAMNRVTDTKWFQLFFPSLQETKPSAAKQ